MEKFYNYSSMENKIQKFSKQLNEGINCEWESVSMKEVQEVMVLRPCKFGNSLIQ